MPGARIRRMYRYLTVISILAALLFPLDAEGQIINTLRGFEDEAQGWSGQIEASIALADGNTDYFEFVTGAAAQFMTPRQRWRIIGRFLDRKSNGVAIADDRMGHVRHNYRFLPWLASVAFVQSQQNRFHRLEKRILAGAGVRFDVIRSEGIDAAVGATYMWETEELTDDDSGFTMDHRMSYFLSVLGKPSDNFEIDISAFFQPLFDDYRDARAFVSATARADIAGGVYFLFSYGLLRDSNPPAGVEETDQTLRSGLGFKF